jgi:general secretion pathway protein F
MTAFSYQAVDAAGRQTRGVIEAVSAAGARRALRDRALLPLSVVTSHQRADPAMGEAAPAASVAGWRGRLARRSVSSRSLATATRQLAMLIGGDVRVEEALRLVAAQSEPQAFAAHLLDVRGAVLEGSGFARALARHPLVFPVYFRASIAAGEQTARLPEVLAYLADFVESRSRASQKVQLALLYPALLAGVSALMMTLMMIYVVPDITRVFVTHGADLPFLTRALIALSNFISTFGLVSVVLLIAAIVLARRELRQPARRLALDRIYATRWPFARFSRLANAARFASTLATLVQSSVPLLEALTAAAAVVPNGYIRAQVEAAAARVREGEAVHRALAGADSFPSMLVAIVASGDSGGKLGPALARAATELDREVESQVAVLVSLVEPAVLLAMGGLVLLLVMAILMPIIGLNDLAIK